MKIAISGYGRMGHEIEAVARQRGHEVLATIDSFEEFEAKKPQLKESDVLIDFSQGDVAERIAEIAFGTGIPVVSGTTGWPEGLARCREKSRENGFPFFYAPNFSLGVNIFFQLSRKLAAELSRIGGYEAHIHEIHHIHKKDAPSGTAIALANGITDVSPNYTGWNLNEGGDSVIPITAERKGEVPGTHEVTWNSPTDSITLVHTAHSRQGFALGAVIAAEWMRNRKGFHTMEELITDLTH